MGLTATEFTNLDFAYDFFNRHLFNTELSDLLITYQYKGRFYGRYIPRLYARRGGIRRDIAEIALNPSVFHECDDIEIFQTLVHEMAHHWQWEHGTPSRTGYHNKQWGLKMKMVGLMPSNTGKPGGKETGQAMADYPIQGGKFLYYAQKLIASGQTVKIVMPPRPKPKPKPVKPAMPLQVPSPDTTTVQPNNAPEVIVTGSPELPTSYKLKYTCPCGNNVWGKPKMKIICGHCEKDYVPQTKGSK